MSQLAFYTGPIWVLCGSQYGAFMATIYGAQMGFANDIGIGPTWVQIWGPYGTFLELYRPYVGIHYRAQVGFANDIGIGPTWV